jgi:acyl carrier protein
VYEQLKNILTTSFQADPAEVTPEATLTDLGLDSLDVVELSLVLKANCGVAVSDDDLLELHGVGAIAEALESRSARL